MPNQLEALSPLDGRYFSQVRELAPIFSEFGLIKKRVMVEIEYLIALSEEKGVKELAPFSKFDKKKLRDLYENFSPAKAEEIKIIEKTTDHDVKAVEYWLREKLAKMPLPVKIESRHSDLRGMASLPTAPRKLREIVLEFIHFALTSEDVNNLSYSLMWQDGLKVYIKNVKKLTTNLKQQAIKHKNLSLLSLTHGQPASPTTLGKELAVFYWRLKEQLKVLESIKLTAKFSGAVGNWNAYLVAYPNIDWQGFSKGFVESLGLEFNPVTTQIEPHDRLAESYDCLKRINNILVDFCQDMWLYISRGIFKQKITETIGSSTMPHKINPIKFENAESNARLSMTLLEHLSRHLPVSRLQRDLRDSTLIRNQGIALGYSLQAVKYCLSGLDRVVPDKSIIKEELDEHWEVLAEAIQTVLRKIGYPQPYETLKKLTRGRKLDKEKLHKFIKSLQIPQKEKSKLLKLVPVSYTGLAGKIVDNFIK